MNEDEINELVYLCPYHGRLSSKHLTPQNTCAKCVEETPVGVVIPLKKLPHTKFLEHSPKHEYDCGRCEFAWCCGPQCACHVPGKMSKARRKEVKQAAMMYLRKVGGL